MCKGFDFKRYKLPVIGITGSIASGKSTVAMLLASKGGYHIDADELLRVVIQGSRPAYRRIVSEFGKGILSAGGQIDRRLLGKLVFSDPAKRRLLERITHPEIMCEAGRLIEGYCKAGDFAPVFLEAALLVEAGLHRSFDALVVVTCERTQQIDRLVRKMGINQEEIERRLSAQLPSEEKVKHATWVVENTGAIEQLTSRVDQLWIEITNSDFFRKKLEEF